MAQIFISHSQRDKPLIDFLLKAFAGTKVKPHLEELEKDLPTGITARKIQNDIQFSNAVFILLSENVENLKHTRDWIAWECGVANNKEIVVLEPSESLGRITVVVPRFNHYVRYDRTDEWRKYLRSFIESYDDSHVIPTLATTTSGGAILNEKDRGGGAAKGFMVGVGWLLLQGLTKPSYGTSVRCNNCASIYKVHGYGNFRCANCNAFLVLNAPGSPVIKSAVTP